MQLFSVLKGKLHQKQVEMERILFRLRGTVILKIWWQILLVSLYTAGVLIVVKFALGWEFKAENSKFQPESLVSVFGLFTGFLLVFRTNEAYDRYWEGRKLWSDVTTNIRILTRLIWTMIPVNNNNPKFANTAIIEKVSVINLLAGFAYALRNYLRNNHLYDEPDLAQFLNHCPNFLKDYNFSGNLSPPRNIPIEISHLIISYVGKTRQLNLIDDPTTTSINNALNNLVDCVAQFEKILKTPIPLAYSVHLSHAVWLFFLALPYKLVGELEWWTIPVVALVAFAMLGILSIGWEIENPFGYDDNDLPLDSFCYVIHQEILNVVGHPLETAEEWTQSPKNIPLLPVSYLPANQLAKMGEPDIREILARLRWRVWI